MRGLRLQRKRVLFDELRERVSRADAELQDRELLFGDGVRGQEGERFNLRDCLRVYLGLLR